MCASIQGLALEALVLKNVALITGKNLA